MRAFMSRPFPYQGAGSLNLDPAEAAVEEARRILAETEPPGGYYARIGQLPADGGNFRAIETKLADALRAFVGSGS